MWEDNVEWLLQDHVNVGTQQTLIHRQDRRAKGQIAVVQVSAAESATNLANQEIGLAEIDFEHPLERSADTYALIPLEDRNIRGLTVAQLYEIQVDNAVAVLERDAYTDIRVAEQDGSPPEIDILEEICCEAVCVAQESEAFPRLLLQLSLHLGLIQVLIDDARREECSKRLLEDRGEMAAEQIVIQTQHPLQERLITLCKLGVVAQVLQLPDHWIGDVELVAQHLFQTWPDEYPIDQPRIRWVFSLIEAHKPNGHQAVMIIELDLDPHRGIAVNELSP